MARWIVIGLIGLFLISTVFIIYCVLSAADYQEDWDEAEMTDVDDIDA